jgi:hypothetical protein
MERGSGNIDQEGRARGGQNRYGIKTVNAPGIPELRVIPGIFTDGNTQHFAFKRYGKNICSRVEIPGFIKNIVGRKQGFMLGSQNLPPANQ